MAQEVTRYDPLSISTLYLRLCVAETNTELATATGFVYEHQDEFFLITNGHNITRVNPETGARTTDHAGFPDQIKTRINVRVKDNPDVMVRSDTLVTIDLYKDNECTTPLWYVHPVFGYTVDVVAIPIEKKSNIPPHVHVRPINHYEWNDDFVPLVSDDVFILGYPMNIVQRVEFPIWKRGSIATEPLLDLDKLPKVLVDTATRAGMSGSPVIYQRDGLHSKHKGDKMHDDDILGRIRGFLGVYSGRIGAEDNFKTQLGVVWKKAVIDEILQAKTIGGIGFQSVKSSW